MNRWTNRQMDRGREGRVDGCLEAVGEVVRESGREKSMFFLYQPNLLSCFGHFCNRNN